MPVLSEGSLSDPYRYYLARHRADEHARRYRDRVGTSGVRVRCDEAALRLSLRQSRANRMKVLVHDGVAIKPGQVSLARHPHGSEVALDVEQLQALVLGLP